MVTEVRYRRARHTAWRTIAEETVVLDLEGKRMYGLNAAAAAIWQALDEVADPGAYLRSAAGGRLPFEELEIGIFIGELTILGLVEERPPAAEDEEAAGAAVEPPAVELPEELEPPAILWREDVEQIAGTCAFFPSVNPLCNQVPFS